jgi:hypothetical protein
MQHRTWQILEIVGMCKTRGCLANAAVDLVRLLYRRRHTQRMRRPRGTSYTTASHTVGANLHHSNTPDARSRPSFAALCGSLLRACTPLPLRGKPHPPNDPASCSLPAPEAFLVAVSSSGGGSGEGGAASAAQEDEIIGWVRGLTGSRGWVESAIAQRHRRPLRPQHRSPDASRLAPSNAGSTTTASPSAVHRYVCGTCSSAATLTHESMSRHEPEGRLLCIHSVCVAEARRRKGVATRCAGILPPCMQSGVAAV